MSIGEITKSIQASIAAIFFVVVFATIQNSIRPAHADPCGMVPPISAGPSFPLVRVGDQNTYVFYKDGVETIVLRPGFSGKVDEFGMLIPFPSPPVIRKMPDEIFAHIAAAVDPPEIVIQPRILYRFSNALAADTAATEDSLTFDSVKVIRQEAVGMYEVAVLEAGSAKALKRWMEDHRYKYPTGMDAACNDYVDAGWCFVAVKTRVGQKLGVEPRPGQTNVDARLPEGSTFQGHVQAMGFRFRVPEMIVPMRLSTFNEGELKNTVYALTDRPVKIANLSDDFVMRQVSGEELFKNLTQPLPLRVIGQAITDQLIKQYAPQRDPQSKNGQAKELFAADLVATTSEDLSLPHEELEKALLSVSESLGLRGSDIDQQHAQALSKAKEETIASALEQLKSMTLTIIDGDFPREILAKENLEFSEFRMDAVKNSPVFYDAKWKKPAPKQAGKLHLGKVDRKDVDRVENARWSYLTFLAFAVGFVVVARKRTRIVLMIAGTVLVLASSTRAAEESTLSNRTVEQLVELFDNRDLAEQAAHEIVRRGIEAYSVLDQLAHHNEASLPSRGWAISCLGHIGGPQADVSLARIQHDENENSLVRTWAAAARIEATDSIELLLEKAPLASQFPAVGRPLAKKLLARIREDADGVSAEQLISLSIRVPALQKDLVEPILESGAEELLSVMLTSRDVNSRRQAAGFLGTLASRTGGVADAIVASLAFDPQATDVPWKDGPLFIPRINWRQKKARSLVDNLIRWHVWCDTHGRSEPQQQIHNNLRSLYLAGAAGYQSPGFNAASTQQWLTIWSNVVGKDAVRTMLQQQGISPSKYGF